MKQQHEKHGVVGLRRVLIAAAAAPLVAHGSMGLGLLLHGARVLDMW